MLTIIHTASGAIVGLTSGDAPPLEPGFATVEGNGNVYDEWWDGEEFAAREDAAVALVPVSAAVGDPVTIAKPADAWARLPDGSISDAADFLMPAGYRAVSVTLLGQYRGEAAGQVEAAR